MICFFFISVFLYATPSLLADDIVDEPIVRTSTATFHGKRIDVHPHQLPDFRRSVAAFTRIPYAEPPVGELRYARPVPKVIRGDFDATRRPIACPQVFIPRWNLKMDTSEDCLYLDVFVPEPKVLRWCACAGMLTGDWSWRDGWLMLP